MCFPPRLYRGFDPLAFTGALHTKVSLYGVGYPIVIVLLLPPTPSSPAS